MQIGTLFSPWRLATLALSAAGAAVFWALSLPLPLLLGPMFACLAAALAGMPLIGVNPLSEGVRPILGVAVGASLTPALVSRLDEMALSVMLVPPFILLIGLAGYPYFRRLWGFDPATSYYAAMPGGLQDMLLFGIEAGANPRALSLIHTTRVLVIVSLMPFLIRWMWELPLTGPPGESAADVPLSELAIMVACGAAGWWLALRVGLFGAPILGPLIVSGIVAFAGGLHFRPPAEAMLFAQFFLGIGIGVKYVGITLAEIRRVFTASIGYCLILTVLSVAFAEIVVQAGVAPPLDAVLAFAPGGQAEMVLLAIIAGTDVAYVVTHHLLRIFIVILGAPFIAGWLRPRAGE
ncbi:MAG TPA: AbrB family transcriptional regulator [Paracoccaceae bacterium]|nr:AbrB family transcriptional regulator [Paracoccaceae bacterium]